MRLNPTGGAAVKSERFIECFMIFHIYVSKLEQVHSDYLFHGKTKPFVSLDT